MTFLATVFCLIAIGFFLGLLGGGGSLFSVPVLVYLAGFKAPVAVGMALAVIAPSAAMAAVFHWRKGFLDPKTALYMAVGGIAGAVGGAQITHWFSDSALLFLYGLVMAASGLAVFLRSKKPQTHAKGWGSLALVLFVGVAVGFLTGFLGIGGGFLLVAALVSVARLDMAHSVGTTLLLVAVNSVFGLFIHVHSISLPWKTTLLLALVCLAGAWWGQHLAGKLADKALRRVFSAFTITVGLILIAVNFVGLFQL